MSPQLMWGMAGLVLTVATLGGVTLSSYQSLDAANAKMVASEVGNVATATKLWVANNSADGTFTGITAEAMTKYIPDLAVTGTGATSVFDSKASTGVTYKVAAGADTSQVVLTADKIPYEQFTPVKTALTGKTCTMAEVTAATSGNKDGKITYTCKG